MDTDSKLDWAEVEATVYSKEIMTLFTKYCKAKYTDQAMAEVEAELQRAFYEGYKTGLRAGIKEATGRVVHKVVYTEPTAKPTRIPPKQIKHS